MKNPIKNESVKVSALLDQAHLMARGRWPAGQPRLLTNTFADLQPFHCHADSFCLCFSESNVTLDIRTRNSFFFPLGGWATRKKKKKMNSWQTCYHSFVNTPTRNKDFFTNFFFFLPSIKWNQFLRGKKQTNKQTKKLVSGHRSQTENLIHFTRCPLVDYRFWLLFKNRNRKVFAMG